MLCNGNGECMCVSGETVSEELLSSGTFEPPNAPAHFTFRWVGILSFVDYKLPRSYVALDKSVGQIHVDAKGKCRISNPPLYLLCPQDLKRMVRE